ncbi:Siroheme synthase [bioreactor metagenome]|uniref:Siroheme synthase n=1 Tax=bioreactor metagenome TaxID=1076179 RepID=A0A645J317_9ZZZZ
MGVKGLDIIAHQLQAHGLPGTTPAALIYRATWPNQKIYPATLATLPEVAHRHAVAPPALLVIGDVVALAENP